MELVQTSLMGVQTYKDGVRLDLEMRMETRDIERIERERRAEEREIERDEREKRAEERDAERLRLELEAKSRVVLRFQKRKKKTGLGPQLKMKQPSQPAQGKGLFQYVHMDQLCHAAGVYIGIEFVKIALPWIGQKLRGPHDDE